MTKKPPADLLPAFVRNVRRKLRSANTNRLRDAPPCKQLAAYRLGFLSWLVWTAFRLKTKIELSDAQALCGYAYIQIENGLVDLAEEMTGGLGAEIRLAATPFLLWSTDSDYPSLRQGQWDSLRRLLKRTTQNSPELEQWLEIGRAMGELFDELALAGDDKLPTLASLTRCIRNLRAYTSLPPILHEFLSMRERQPRWNVAMLLSKLLDTESSKAHSIRQIAFDATASLHVLLQRQISELEPFTHQIVMMGNNTVTINGEPHVVGPRWWQILNALVDAAKHGDWLVKSGKLQTLPQCEGMNCPREIKNLKKEIPALGNLIVSSAAPGGGYRLVRY